MNAPRLRLVGAYAGLLMAVGALAAGAGLGQQPAPPAAPRAPGWNNADVAGKTPSVIPHPIYEMPCTACHGLKSTEAPRIPHKLYPNCRQCHVPQTDAKLFRANTFTPRKAPPAAAKPAVKPAPKANRAKQPAEPAAAKTTRKKAR